MSLCKISWQLVYVTVPLDKWLGKLIPSTLPYVIEIVIWWNVIRLDVFVQNVMATLCLSDAIMEQSVRKGLKHQLIFEGQKNKNVKKTFLQKLAQDKRRWRFSTKIKFSCTTSFSVFSSVMMYCAKNKEFWFVSPIIWVWRLVNIKLIF